MRPGSKPKIDLEVLDEMLSDGKSCKECAEFFGVSSPAITQAKKKLKRAVTIASAVEKAPVIIEKHLDVIGQLNKINKNTHELVDLCMAWSRGDPEAIQVLESQKRKIRTGSKEEGVEEWVTEFKFKDPRELALRGITEIRNQLDLQAKLFKMLSEAKQVDLFIKSVIEIMGEMDVKLRDKFVKRLRQQQIVFSSFTQY